MFAMTIYVLIDFFCALTSNSTSIQLLIECIYFTNQ